MPGSRGIVEQEKAALEVAKKIGYPVIIKAAAGGGGRGLRVVNREEDLIQAFQAAQAEAKTAFGDEGVYLEKYFLEPRHIEVQILADERGRVIHLERAGLHGSTSPPEADRGIPLAGRG